MDTTGLVTRADILRVARGYIGTPYHHQGRAPGAGMDCAGILVALARELGLYFPDRGGYTRQADGVTLQAEIEARCVPVETAEPGDVMLFWIKRPSKPCHVALATDIGMLHAYANCEKVVETCMDEWWQQRLIQAYRFRGVA